MRKPSQGSPKQIVPSPPPANVGWMASSVMGKSVESVTPETKAFPAWSTPRPPVNSSPVAPRYVEYTRSDPLGFSFESVPSKEPALDGWNTPGVVGNPGPV